MVRIEIVPDIRKKMKEDNKYLRDVLRGKVPLKPAVRTIVLTPETFPKVFSPQRLSLLLKIKVEGKKNIYQLAKDLGRPYEAVHRDIKYLESFKLIKIRTKDKKKLPYVDAPITIPAFA
jgi:hypothetical protein